MSCFFSAFGSNPMSLAATSPCCNSFSLPRGFAVDSYEPPAPDNLKNVHMHLTNYSLNKKADNFKYDCDDASGGDGSKRTVSSVFERLQSTGRIESVNELWQDIERLVARSMGVVQPILAGSRGRWSNTCFFSCPYTKLCSMHSSELIDLLFLSTI